ncbi:MAG: FtsX-like permease family protein [Luteitalea sp.]|nr:FtsX-like permease family protein [Luteitalea sp.]
MRFAARARSWVRAVLRHARLQREMDEELRFHIEAYVDDLVQAGVPAAEARRRARSEFGSVDARKEECREALGLRLVDELTGDLRYAWRQLRRSPAFTAVAVVSLALGIGANTAIFSLMETALWRSIPVHRPEQLRLFSWVSGFNHGGNGSGQINRTAGGGYTSAPFSYPVFQELQRQNNVFETVFAFKPTGRVTAVIDGNAELLGSILVTANFYKGVGVQPALGRVLGATDASDATEAAAVISDGLWARRFGRDSSVIGKRISVNGTPVTIVGVNPPEFTGVQPGAHPEIFLPMRLQPIVSPWGENASVLADPDFWWVLVFGRLRPNVSTAQAEAALDVVLQRAVRAWLPDRIDRDPPRLALLSGARGLDRLSEDFSRPLLVLFSLVGVVLLIACANVANLLLARAATRQREISLRRALGAGRWRVARQLLTEGLVLACLGGAAGILLGYWIGDAIPSLLATSWTRAPFQAAFNWRVVGFSVAATTATGILFSLAPAWRSACIEINAALKETGRVGVGLPRWSRGKPLAMCQAALSILLLIGAGLFARSLWNLTSVSLGFQPDRVLLFALDPPRTRYPDAQRHAILDQLHQRIAAVPGVERATLSSRRVLGGERGRNSVHPDITTPPDQPRSAWFNDVGHDFFETMGIPILHGRSFNRLDRQTSQPVAVVNQRFVREFFPGETPLGEVFRNGDRILRIVGIVGDTRDRDLRTPFPPTFYRLYLQGSLASHGAMTFAVRTAADDGNVVAAIREAVRSIDGALPMFDVRTQNEQIAATVSQERLFVTLSTAFALLAVILAAVGVYGIMANTVARRTNEIGIRIALGARRERVLWMILREAALVAAIGIAVGVAAAMMLTRYIQSMLFGVKPVDPPTIAAAVLLMLVVALLAGWLPARRASRLEPMVALRHE